MHPIERLRYVARDRESDPVEVAEEAAVALGSLGYERRALVPSCRRLLEAHRSCGPLWWVAARLLVAENIHDEVMEILDELSRDETIEELAAALPSAAKVAAEASRPIVDALGMRPDIEINLLGSPRRLRSELHSFGIEAKVSGWYFDDADDAVADADLAIVGALIAGPQGFLLSDAGVLLTDAAARQSVPCWVRVSTTHLLPASLFARALSLNGVLDDEEGVTPTVDGDASADREDVHPPQVAFRPVSVATRVVGRGGIQLPKRALAHQSCRAPAELLFSIPDH